MSESVQPILVLVSSTAGANPTQFMMERAFAHHDLDWRYITVEVAQEALADALGGVRAMGFRGGHLADAHKEAAVPLLTRTTEAASAVGAVNFLFREQDELVGGNTEGQGVVESLRAVVEPEGKRFLVLGAGRVARAVGFELSAAGAAEIVVVDRTPERGQALAESLVQKGTAASAVTWKGALEIPAETDVLIQATTLGREDSHDRPPIRVDSLRPELVVADVTIEPPQTWLLIEAAARGCKQVDGLTMFVEQAAIAFRQWTGVTPDRQILRDAVEEFLEL
ncbi:MAG: shikimate dehydrogenase family protein [Planctomycetota bacterium]